MMPPTEKRFQNLRERSARDRLAHPKPDFIIGEQACKPDSVSRRAGMAIIHLGRGIASGLQRPTRGSPLVPASRGEVAERATPPPLFGLAPCGVFPAPEVALRAVRSYIKPLNQAISGPHLFTLTPAVFRQPCGRQAAALGRYIFCGTVRIGKTPPGCAGEARPTLAVSQHTALWSPDFPLPGEPGSDHPACSPTDISMKDSGTKFNQAFRAATASAGQTDGGPWKTSSFLQSGFTACGPDR